MSCPPDVLNKLASLRETLMHGEQVQGYLCKWWAALQAADKRTFLALAGLDDSVQAARRAWAQILPDDQKQIMAECKRLQKLTAAIRWA